LSSDRVLVVRDRDLKKRVGAGRTGSGAGGGGGEGNLSANADVELQRERCDWWEGGHGRGQRRVVVVGDANEARGWM
jgi:hypothetical protein